MDATIDVMQSTPILYLMLGYPGAGKTTAAKVIHELTGATHLWADHERRLIFKKPTYSHEENLSLYAGLNHQAQELLKEGKSVVFDTNFNFYKDRQKLRKIAADSGAASTLIWVRTPMELAKKRATVDAHQQETRVLGDMPPEQFDRMASNLQPPHEDEPYIEVDGTKISPEYIAALLKND
jgi:predicted kinase